MLRNRLISAIVLIPTILGSIILGGPSYFLLVAAMLLIAGFEFFRMAESAGHHPNLVLGLALILALLVDAFLDSRATREILVAAVMLSLIAAVYWRTEGWLVGWALTLAGALYLGLLGGYFFALRALDQGTLWTAIVMLATWASDTAAYVAGTNWGRHRFFAAISPKKTWEGAIGGWVAALVTMAVLGWIAGLPLPHGIVLGLGIGIMGSLGDLAESVIKRQLGAKDSGGSVPGHGGFLDRVDSLLFTVVLAFFYLFWIVRLP